MIGRTLAKTVRSTLTRSALQYAIKQPSIYYGSVCMNKTQGMGLNSNQVSRYFCAETKSHVVECESNEHWEKVLSTQGQYIVVDFFATWCGPCKTLLPRLVEKIEGGNGKYTMLKVDIDKHPEIASSVEIPGVPTVFMIKDGDMVANFSGNVSDKDLEEFFAKAV